MLRLLEHGYRRQPIEDMSPQKSGWPKLMRPAIRYLQMPQLTWTSSRAPRGCNKHLYLRVVLERPRSLQLGREPIGGPPASRTIEESSRMKRIAILGSTGSIGRSTLSVVESYPDRFEVATLAAGSNVDAALEQALRWKPRVLSLADERDAEAVRGKLRAAGLNEIEVVHGVAGTVRVATHPDVDFVVSAIVGVSGLEATYEAVRTGKTVGLANKECLVVAGELITAEARRQGKPLLPIDSEHNAVHQCLRGGRMEEVERIWLTASGGPFLTTPKSEFASITVQQALNHPTWKMGKRITIDSATLMNKGFEVIEACRLFDIPPATVEVMVHPQSTIHSFVEFVDGSILAQLSVTDMRLPVLYALTYPERIPSELRLSISDLSHP